MIDTIAGTKTLSGGRVARFTNARSTANRATLNAYIGEDLVVSKAEIVSLAVLTPKAAAPYRAVNPNASHFVGRITLTPSEAEPLLAAVAAHQAAIDAEPEVALENLIRERRSLVRKIDAISEAREEHVNRNFEDESKAANPFAGAKSYDAKHEAARAELAAFDAAHPETLAEINRRKKEDIARFDRRD